MTLAELIRTRRTIGAFTEQPVSRDLITDLLETAIFAPNHKMTEPWRFVIADGDACGDYANLRRELAGEIGKDPDKEYKKYASVPCFVFVLMKQTEHAHTREEDYAATSSLIQNFMLLAWEQGLGTAWKTWPDDARLRQFLNMNERETVVGVIHTGYPAEERQTPRRKSAQSLITYVG